LEVGALEVGRCDELAGLFLGGLVSLLLEAGWEWLIEPDHWYSNGPRRRTRLTYTALAVALVSVAILVMRRLV